MTVLTYYLGAQVSVPLPRTGLVSRSGPLSLP